MAFLGLIPLLIGMGAAYPNKKKQAAVQQDLSMPNFASTSVLLAQDKERRKAQNRVSRQSTKVTGGLMGSPSLGRGSLWGLG